MSRGIIRLLSQTLCPLPKCDCTKWPAVQGQLRESSDPHFPAVLPVSLRSGTSEDLEVSLSTTSWKGTPVWGRSLGEGVHVQLM